jgi:hypothetical protein
MDETEPPDDTLVKLTEAGPRGADVLIEWYGVRPPQYLEERWRRVWARFAEENLQPGPRPGPAKKRPDLA